MDIKQALTIDRAHAGIIETLLSNYDERLKDKAEIYANRMSDYLVENYFNEAIEYANKYSVINVERQRVHECLQVIKKGLSATNSDGCGWVD